MRTILLFGMATLAAASGCGGNGGGNGATGVHRLNHIVVVVLENWSFDSLYAEFPGAEGLTGARAAPPQIDATGTAYATLPQTETHLPQTLPNGPFPLFRAQDFWHFITHLRREHAEPYLLDLWARCPEFQKFG